MMLNIRDPHPYMRHQPATPKSRQPCKNHRPGPLTPTLTGYPRKHQNHRIWNKASPSMIQKAPFWETIQMSPHNHYHNTEDRITKKGPSMCHQTDPPPHRDYHPPTPSTSSPTPQPQTTLIPSPNKTGPNHHTPYNHESYLTKCTRSNRVFQTQTYTNQT